MKGGKAKRRWMTTELFCTQKGSDPQFVDGPVWIFECQHMTMCPDDSCSICAKLVQVVKDFRDKKIAEITARCEHSLRGTGGAPLSDDRLFEAISILEVDHE